MYARSNAPLAELLEDRRLLSVTLNSAGFSVITPDANSRTIYVSASSGSDSNSGLTALLPVASLAQGYSLLRNGYDDQLLLKRGDTWTTTFGAWKLSGESAQFPMLIGTYGSGNRPVIDCGYGDGFDAYKNPVNYVFMQGIQFIDNLRDPTETTVSTTAAQANSVGFELEQPSTGFTIEDCSFTYFDNNLQIQNNNTSAGVITNVLIRRSVIANSYCTNGHSQGLYAALTNGITLDQDVFDHNGWNANVSGGGQTGYNHDIYGVSTAIGMVVTNSIIADASATGVLSRGGGVIDGNLFENDAVGVSFGEANGAASTVGGVTGQINNNVFMDNHPEGTTALGQGIDIGNITPASGVSISGNIFADDDEKVSAAITLDYATGTTNPTACVGINDLVVSNNIIYGWYDGLQLSPFDDTTPLTTLDDVIITGNQLQSDSLFLVNHQGAYFPAQEHWNGNVYYSTYGAPFHLQNSYPTNADWTSVDPAAIFQQENYLDATRTPATYNAVLGGASTLAAFMAIEDSQSDLNWNTAYMAPNVLSYLRAGFAVPVSIAAGQSSTIANDPDGHTVSAIANLTIAGTTNAWTGTLDLTNNDLDISNGSLATITNQIAQGYANGKWTGPGITSSAAAASTAHLTAVGVIQNNQSGTAVFNATNPLDGVVPGASDILLKYTYFGDTNLDGKVDGSDYSQIDNGFLNHLTGWFNGDFNYDGVINGSDYTLIDNAFNTQGASLAAQVANSDAIAPASKPAVTATNSFSSSVIDSEEKHRRAGSQSLFKAVHAMSESF